ncbi:MAG: tRNA adenosine(34) deaminase TadA [bacterium]|nr:tRNA adenosine(34) deaminase TadA [bacterium]
MNDDIVWMREALDEAAKAYRMCEVPIGAVVVSDGRIIGRGRNAKELLNDPTAHAEVMALRAAAEFAGSWRLCGSSLYVTKEPCPMCAGAMVQARVERLVYGVPDEKYGAAGSVFDIANTPALNHRLEVTGGVLQEECAQILLNFFRELRVRTF